MPRPKGWKDPHLSDDDFFRMISSRANYLNEDVVREVYYEMVRIMVYQLRTKKTVRMPDFGDLRITLHKERIGVDVNTKERKHIQAYHTVKFTPNKKLRDFFRAFGGDDKKMTDVKPLKD